MMVIEHADFDGIERLAASCGAEILSTFDNPERKDEVLGSCELIEEMMIGEDIVIKFSGCKKGEACSIVIRGASKHIVDEAERSLHVLDFYFYFILFKKKKKLLLIIIKINYFCLLSINSNK